MANRNVVIIGAGAMGSAFCLPLADNGCTVDLVGTHLDNALIEESQRTGTHPRSGVRYPSNVKTFRFEELASLMHRPPDVIVVAVSSPGIDWAIDQLRTHLREPVPIVMLTKGLSANDGSLGVLTDAIAGALASAPGVDVPVVGVAGPCIAKELAARRLTSVVIAAPKSEITEGIRSYLETGYYRVVASADVIGVEACAAYKNFYALAIGASVGWSEVAPAPANGAAMHNTTASMFARALNEMDYLVGQLGGESATVHGLAGAGDLYVTCRAGRNSRMGRLLGQGMLFGEARRAHMPNDTIEGADLARVIGPIVEHGIEAGEIDASRIPMAVSTINAICHEQPFELSWEELWPRRS